MTLALAAAWRQRIKLWAEAIIKTYGNITLSWSWKSEHGECTLENGDVYSSDTVSSEEEST